MPSVLKAPIITMQREAELNIKPELQEQPSEIKFEKGAHSWIALFPQKQQLWPPPPAIQLPGMFRQGKKTYGAKKKITGTK